MRATPDDVGLENAQDITYPSVLSGKSARALTRGYGDYLCAAPQEWEQRVILRIDAHQRR